jgi:eukaryotic-like serine/threonine-protein kinase
VTDRDVEEGEITLAGDEASHTRSNERVVVAELRGGAVVGRYVVLSRIGMGGMGVVHAAYDPELDRKVALKLLLPEAGGGEPSSGPDARARIVREARALARLQHPNVVTVHDVGEHEGRVWLAMEYVEGRTLGAWRRERPRSWREVLAVMVRAGRGVAAAHAAGLLHRDLKPDNIMVADDGRVRVMDFGLARTQDVGGSSPVPLGDAAVRLEPEALASRVTRTGAMVGTPAYMSPEQLQGTSVGPATDQFSFCVTLWEALWRTRPFAGETAVDLMVAVLEGDVRAPPPGTKVPGWLRRVVERGLSVDAEARWPSMEALLDALARGQTRSRWRRGLEVVGVLGVCVAGLAGWREVQRRRAVAQCEAAAASIAEVWNDDTRATLRAALVGTGVSYADTTADKAMPWLDAQANAWQTARTEVCLDTEVYGTWDADVSERALWCLEERRMQLEALLVELSRGESRSVETVVQAAAGLGSVEPCRQKDLLERLPSPPKALRNDLRSVRAELSRAGALRRTGAYDQGLAVARDALEDAEQSAWPPLVAEARLAKGALLESTGAYEPARETLEAAYFEAARAGAAEVAIEAAEQLVFIVGYRLARRSEGLLWARHAETMMASVAEASRLRLARHAQNLAAVHMAAGAHDEASTLYERALVLMEEALAPGHPDVAVSLANLANAHTARGEYAEATKLHEKALAILEATLGPDHPDVATGCFNLARIHYFTGSYGESTALHERALGIREKALRPEHPDIAQSLEGLAETRAAAGSYDEAMALHTRALAIREEALGPDHPNVALSLHGLASLHRAMGSYEKSRALHLRALAVQERTLEPDHPDLATSLNDLASVDYAMGAVEAAKAAQERALAIREKAFGGDHPDVAQSLNNLGVIHWKLGSHDESRALHERALAIREAMLGFDHPAVANSLGNLANAHSAMGSYEQAKALQERALAIREKALGVDHPDVAAILVNLGGVHRAMGALAEATASFERALAVREKALGPEHPLVAQPLIGLARVALARGSATDAVGRARRAVEVLEGAGGSAADVAEARFVLAQGLWAANLERPHALALADRARQAYREAGPATAKQLAEVDGWLRKRRAHRSVATVVE